MPLNNHPSAKPTYDFYDTVTAGPYGDRERPAAVAAYAPARQQVPRTARRPSTGARARRSPATSSRTASAASTCTSRRRLRRRALLRGPGAARSARRASGQPEGDGPAAGHHRLPEHVQRAVPLPHRRRARRPPLGQLRGGDADDDHLRRRADRPRHLQPREHAPVVGRQRLRGELQPDLLQGGHGHARGVPLRARATRSRGRRSGHGGRARGVPAEPGRTSSTPTTPAPGASGRPPLRPDARPAVLRQHDVRPARHGVPRPASDPRPARVRPGAAADPAPLRRRQHHRAAARGAVRPFPAAPQPRPAGRGSGPSSPSGSTPPTRPAAAPTARSSPARARTGRLLRRGAATADRQATFRQPASA